MTGRSGGSRGSLRRGRMRRRRIPRRSLSRRLGIGGRSGGRGWSWLLCWLIGLVPWSVIPMAFSSSMLVLMRLGPCGCVSPLSLTSPLGVTNREPDVPRRCRPLFSTVAAPRRQVPESCLVPFTKSPVRNWGLRQLCNRVQSQ